MKKIIIIDGGPRTTFNTASMHWEEDLQKAFEAGKRMAETIIKS